MRAEVFSECQDVIRNRLEMKMCTTTTERFEIIKGTAHPSNTDKPQLALKLIAKIFTKLYVSSMEIR